MGRGLFGWDLPPGCKVSDIPGNRPEDEAWDKMMDTFFQQTSFTEAEKKVIDEQVVVDIITKAIEYGIEIGVKQAKADEEENKFYEEQARAYKEEHPEQ